MIFAAGSLNFYNPGIVVVTFLNRLIEITVCTIYVSNFQFVGRKSNISLHVPDVVGLVNLKSDRRRNSLSVI